jgi:hypothetical protein
MSRGLQRVCGTPYALWIAAGQVDRAGFAQSDA